jgi:hypothetical protein
MDKAAVKRRDWWVIPVLWAAGALLFLPLLRTRFIGDDYTALSIFRFYRSKPFLETILIWGQRLLQATEHGAHHGQGSGVR